MDPPRFQNSPIVDKSWVGMALALEAFRVLILPMLSKKRSDIQNKMDSLQKVAKIHKAKVQKGTRVGNCVLLV